MDKKVADWDDAKIEEFKKDYSWMDFNKMEPKYGLSKRLLKQQAARYGLPACRNRKGMSRLFGPDQIKEILADYALGKTSAVIGLERGCSGVEIRQILAGNGVARRRRKYFFNERYFDSIDSREKAYFLGFIFANSHVDAHGVAFTQSVKNREMLENLKTALQATNPVMDYADGRGAPRCGLRLMSNAMAKTLGKYGLTKRPTGVIFPELPEEYYAPFTLGYFEGCGCVIKWGFKLTGTRHIVLRLQNILMKYCALYPLKLAIDPKFPNYTVVGYHGIRQITRIFNFLYADPPHRVTWKYLKFKEIIDNYGKTESTAV